MTISAGKDVLWSGSLRVARGVPASYSRQQSEADAPECRRDAPFGRWNGVQTSLSFNLSTYSPNVTNVQVEWTRPSSICGGGNAADPGSGGTRTVRISERVDLTTGRPITIRGDADMVVRLSVR